MWNQKDAIIDLQSMFGYSKCILCCDDISFLNLRFENDVKMYGTQTYDNGRIVMAPFENDVKMYGTQTCI